jgi:catalase
MVPGIEPSEDRTLQGRLFSYADTQMYRLGANFNDLPINRPRVPVVNNNQDGATNSGDRKGEVNQDAQLPAGGGVLPHAASAEQAGSRDGAVQRSEPCDQRREQVRAAVVLLQGGCRLRYPPCASDA